MPPAFRRDLLWPSLFALIGLAILVSLGAWQVQRLSWKEALIARVEAGTRAAPIPAPAPDAWAGLDFESMEYRPVTASGRFRHGDEAHVHAVLGSPRGRFGGVGYWVLTPFVTEAGWTVIVNRGFVPDRAKDPQTRVGGQVEGPVTLTGLLRRPDERSFATPEDDIARNVWFARDPAAIGRARGLDAGGLAPYFIDAAFDLSLPDGLPQGGETILAFPNNHLQYAVTWFGLAAALAGVYIAFMIGRLKGRDADG